MAKTVSMAVMKTLVTLMACSNDSEGLDAAQESALMAAVAEGNWQGIERICTDWKARQPESPVATGLLRGAFVERNKIKQASVLEGELALFKENHWQEVVSFLERIKKAYGESAIAWTLLSVAQTTAEIEEEGLKSADRAVSLDEKCTWAWYNKGWALYKRGRYEEAMNCCDKAIQINPNYAIAWYGKCGVLYKMGRYEEVIKCYDKAIQINPDDAGGWYGKGLALKQMGRYDEAVNCYDKAIQITPHIPSGAWYNRGLALYQLKRYKEAKECFKKSEHPQARQMLKRTVKSLDRAGH